MIGFIIAFECALALVFLAFFRRYRRGRGFYPLYFLFKRLRTTPGQEQVIRSALSRVRDSGRSVLRQADDARPELAEMLRADTFDEASARTWLSSRQKSFEEFKPELVETLREVHSVLDPDQRKALGDALSSDSFGWNRHHHHYHHHHHGRRWC